MIFWIVLIVFGIPLIQYLFSLYNDKKQNQRKLTKIQQRLKEIEARNKKNTDL